MWLENIKKQDFWLPLEIEKVSIYNPIEQIEHNLEDLEWKQVLLYHHFLPLGIFLKVFSKVKD